MFKSMRKACTIGLLLFSSVLAYREEPETALSDDGVFDIKSPGMGLRLEKQTINEFIQSMNGFLPHFVNNDIKMPKELVYDWALFKDYFKWHFKFYEIEVDHAQFDIRKTQCFFNDIPGLSMIDINFPGLKHWKMDALMDSNTYWIPDGSKMHIEFEDFQVGFKSGLYVTDEGYLRPRVYNMFTKWGESNFYHDNAFIQAYMHQIIKFGFVMLENTIFFVGDTIFTRFGEPFLQRLLNDYRLPLDNVRSPFQGQPVHDVNFQLDFRNTMDPEITSERIDFKFFGELVFADHICTLEHEPFDFLGEDVFDAGTSQIVITDSAASCNLNAIAKSDLGKFSFNEAKLNQFFGVDYLKFDTTSFAEHMPIFKQKLGAGKPLLMFIAFKDIKVQFGKYDSDVIADYTMQVSFSLDEPRTKMLVHDEFRMTTTANLKTHNDRMFLDLKTHKLNLDHSANKKQPKTNSMEMTTNEYRQFLVTFEKTASNMFEWMGENVKDGIKFPYHPDEILTNVQFAEGSMHVMMEVEQQLEVFLEDEFWFDQNRVRKDENY